LLILKSPVIKDQGDIIAEFKSLDKESWEKGGVALWTDKHGSHRLKYDFYTDANKYDVSARISETSFPILLVQGRKDKVVPVSQCLSLKKQGNLEMRIIDTADHKFTDQEMNQFVEYCKTFIQKHWRVSV